MNMDSYELKAGDNLTTFEFLSYGIKGKIPKLIQFTELVQFTELIGEVVFNLSFGDKDLILGGIDDTIVSNNGDVEKVLATVAETIYTFTDIRQGTWVYATGSTKSRSRLYRMRISKFLKEAERILKY